MLKYECSCYTLKQNTHTHTHTHAHIGLAVRVFTSGPGGLGSIPGRVIPKTQKVVLDASLLNTQHYKVRIKGKVEQSRERSRALPYLGVVSYRKGSLRVTLDYGRQLYLLIYIYIYIYIYISNHGSSQLFPLVVVPSLLSFFIFLILISTFNYLSSGSFVIFLYPFLFQCIL